MACFRLVLENHVLGDFLGIVPICLVHELYLDALVPKSVIEEFLKLFIFGRKALAFLHWEALLKDGEVMINLISILHKELNFEVIIRNDNFLAAFAEVGRARILFVQPFGARRTAWVDPGIIKDVNHSLHLAIIQLDAFKFLGFLICDVLDDSGHAGFDVFGLFHFGVVLNHQVFDRIDAPELQFSD